MLIHNALESSQFFISTHLLSTLFPFFLCRREIRFSSKQHTTEDLMETFYLQIDCIEDSEKEEKTLQGRIAQNLLPMIECRYGSLWVSQMLEIAEAIKAAHNFKNQLNSSIIICVPRGHEKSILDLNSTSHDLHCSSSITQKCRHSFSLAWINNFYWNCQSHFET